MAAREGRFLFRSQRKQTKTAVEERIPGGLLFARQSIDGPAITEPMQRKKPLPYNGSLNKHPEPTWSEHPTLSEVPFGVGAGGGLWAPKSPSRKILRLSPSSTQTGSEAFEAFAAFLADFETLAKVAGADAVDKVENDARDDHDEDG